MAGSKKATKVVAPREPSLRPLGAKPKPWEMQEGESLNDFHFFRFYRDMQRRSVRKASQVFGHKTSRVFERLSSKQNWPDRARAWDVELDRRVRDLQTADIADMRKRHINIGIGMQTAVVKELQAHVQQIEDAHALAVAAGKKHHIPLLSVSDIIRLSQHGTQLERLSRGEPTDHTKVDMPEEADLSMLTAKELKALKILKAKLKQ